MTRTALVLALLGFIVPAFASTDFQDKEVTRTAIPNQYIVQFVTSSKVSNLSKLAEVMNLPFLEMTESERLGAAQVIFSQPFKLKGTHKTLVYFDKSNLDSYTWKRIVDGPQAVAVYPNYRYSGEFREDISDPDDEMFEKQPHHSVMENILAWDLLSHTETVVVAVTDDGVDTQHEDLRDNIYRNENEIPGNNIDDDGNGYIDDVMGWDFADKDNDANPSNGSHGTHVAGIIGAVANNGVGVAGTAAPIVKIMPLRFYNGFSFTSATVAKTFKYAADNGADIITTSYNIDYFVGDKVYEDAIAYVYDKGLLHFNSAGNAGSHGPRRQAFQELILVCSTKAKAKGENGTDKKSGFSNYGPGIDLCAPGSDILSTVPSGYEKKSGTSMAAPNAAAVAALIWAQNPRWTRDQVVAQLLSTSEDISSANPDYVGELGAGRVNSYLALSVNSVAAPQLASIDEIKSEKASKGVTSFSVRFSHLLDSKTVEPRSFGLYGPQGKVTVGIERPYKAGSNEVLLSFNELDPGDYTLYVRPSLKDPFGQALDGNGDGVPGDERVISFRVEN